MTRYKLYVLDPGDAISRIVDCEGRDDLDALEQARAMSADNTIEVWQANKRIARVKRGDAPSGPQDSIPG